MKPEANSLAISSPMALHLLSSKRRSRCWTGLDPGKMRSSFSATSLGMPDMSDDFQAKVSLLARRKSMSACSYLVGSWEPIRTVFVGSAPSTAIALVSSIETKAGAWLGLPGSGRHSAVVERSWPSSDEFAAVVARS